MGKKFSCFGAGLVALDVVLNGNPATLPKLSAGGSCGNVLSILSYLGWNSFPIARLANDRAAAELINDLRRWHVHTDHITINDNGSTPIIIHRILKDKTGRPVHRFEFRDPESKSWLPQFKAITKSTATTLIKDSLQPGVFYFDRMNPGTYDLAKHFKSKGSIIFFEPSSAKDSNQFEKFLAIADIVKFSNERIIDFKEKYPSIKCSLEIETQGKAGLVYRTKMSSTPDNWKRCEGFPLPDVQDAAGAGDWCTAGIIHKLCCVSPLDFISGEIATVEDALRFGQALGTLNCLYTGARGVMYFYEASELLAIALKLASKKHIDRNSLLLAPKIDVSMNIGFSELLKR